MMVAIFAAMLLALTAAWLGWARLAAVSVIIGLALLIGLFLFEIYSPDYGFRMPWLQTELDRPPAASGRPA
jgi:hypothetical protein